MSAAVPSSQSVGRQIVLPLSKAVEIAYKSIRQRLSRSLLVTSGIVLALAFLTSILATQAINDGMRGWHNRLIALRTKLGTEMSETAQRQRDLEARSPNDPGLAEIKQQLANQQSAFNDRHQQFADAQELEQLMSARGMPITEEDIQADRLQTRWLLGLALMVAFVGILNAMLMSVTERFREIGTMKCLGALNSFIVKLFLIESLFQGVIGTIIGVTAGLGLSFVTAWVNYHAFIWNELQVERIVMRVLFCVVVGVGLTVAGAVYPAWQAARMQPIEAMRVEA